MQLRIRKNTSKQDSVYKDASIVACVTSGVNVYININEKNQQGDKKSTKKVIFDCICLGAMEGVKYIAKQKISKNFKNQKSNIVIKGTQSSLKSGLKTCGGIAFNLGVQIAMKSVNDLVKLKNGKINNDECIRNIKTNTCSVVGSFIVARGFTLVGGVMLSGVGAVAIGIAGAYAGEYVGKKIAKKLF